MLGNSVGSLLEGRGSVGKLPGAMCEEGGAVQFGGPRGKSGDSADLVQDKIKLVPANNQSNNESVVGESCSSINNGSTVDSESFHTVCNSNSSFQVEEEVSKGLSPPPSGSVREEVESLEDQAQGEDERDPALETCTLEACGVVLTIQSANLAAVSNNTFQLGTFELIIKSESNCYSPTQNYC